MLSAYADEASRSCLPRPNGDFAGEDEIKNKRDGKSLPAEFMEEKRLKMSLRALVAVLVLLQTPVVFFAQTSVEVRVTDPSGASISGAQVSLSSSQGTAIRSLVTDASGNFSLKDLSRGSYVAEILVPGFEKKVTTIRVPSAGVQTVQLEVVSYHAEITVTANRGSAEEVEAALQFITSKGRDQLVQRPLATIANALEGAPGVMIQQTTYTGASPILHGQTGYQTLLLMDGIRFNTSIFRSGPNQYIGFMDPSAAERIEVTLGPSSANYGSDSMGGTINVLSQPARFGTGSGRQIHGEFNTMGASADLSGTHSGRMNVGSKRVAILVGGSLTQHNDLRAGQGTDSHNVYRRFFGLSNDQIKGVFGDRLQNTGFLQYSTDATVAARLTPTQTMTFRYLRSDIQNGRSYRDTYGGANRMKSIFDPQSLNFGFVRYETQKAGPLDSFSATASVNQQNDGATVKGALITDIETTDRSQVTARGYATQATAHIGGRQAIAFGGEIYDEGIRSTRFNLDPVAGTNLRTGRSTLINHATSPADSSFRTRSNCGTTACAPQRGSATPASTTPPTRRTMLPREEEVSV